MKELITIGIARSFDEIDSLMPKAPESPLQHSGASFSLIQSVKLEKIGIIFFSANFSFDRYEFYSRQNA